MTVVLFLVVLFILILVHEWGHFIVAKKTGMRVDEFGIGFPPKMFGIKKGETEYTFNWLPIGGFVRIYGENLEEFSPVSDEVGDGQPEPVEGEAGQGGSNSDASRAFSSRPKWAQALVLIAGISMNIIFAWFLFALTFMIGVPTAVDESTASESAELYISATLPDSPASVVPDGSKVIAVTAGENELDTLGPQSFSDFVVDNAPNAINVTYEVGSETVTSEVTPKQGLFEDNPERYLVGASLILIETQRMSFGSAIMQAFVATKDTLIGITVGLSTLIVQSFAGTADYSQIAGPIGIVSMVGDAAAFGFTSLLTFTAIISLNLAVINLLPFPALDGGRLLFVAIEAVTRKPISAVWAGRVNLAGFAILMILMVAVTYNDILRLL